jgi:Terpene synthase family 2, C-terminal metal binding
VFDNGELKNLKDDPEAAKLMMKSLLSIMGSFVPNDELRSRHEFEGVVDGEHNQKDALVRVHDSVWRRICASNQPGTCRRFAKAMTDYAVGALKHVQATHDERDVSVEEMLATRRQSAGVRPCFTLVEYAHGIMLPDEVFELPALKKIEELGIDFVVIHNDIFSYLKEEAEGVTNSLVATYRKQGASAQGAFDHAATLLDERFEEWEEAVRELKGMTRSSVQRDVMKYVRGVQNVAFANVVWR